MGRAARASGEFLTGVLAGVVLGYVAALLLAPYEGLESRARLQGSATALRDRPRHLADEVQARVQRAVEQGRQAAAQTRAELERAAGMSPSDLASGPDDTAEAESTSI